MTSRQRHTTSASSYGSRWAQFARRYGWRAYAVAVLAVVTVAVLVRGALPARTATAADALHPAAPEAATAPATPTTTRAPATSQTPLHRQPSGHHTPSSTLAVRSTAAAARTTAGPHRPASRTRSTAASPSAPAPQVSAALDAATCAKNRHQELVLVSISRQHLWACEGGKPVKSTAVTTGAAVNNHNTPLGSWRVQAKQRDRYLRGPGYVDYVKYWMPFNGDFGLHDASWQTMPFGSKDWRTRGSHGCVHLPTATMAWLYKWADPGSTVVTIES